MALRSLMKHETNHVAKTSVAQLYRSMVKEIPRVLIIYDVDMPLKTARKAIAYHFRKHNELKDGRVIGLLLAKGYMELEETLMQWKQKTHLLRILEPMELEKKTDISQFTEQDKLILRLNQGFA